MLSDAMRPQVLMFNLIKNSLCRAGNFRNSGNSAAAILYSADNSGKFGNSAAAILYSAGNSGNSAAAL
ncbi:hypothetical protein KY285_030412 [Solanum tuberosum]|nr:hypothetical protein KY285_030412 [Solanum tuberosum]